MVDLTLLEFYRNNYLINDKISIIKHDNKKSLKFINKVDKKKRIIKTIKSKIIWSLVMK